MRDFHYQYEWLILGCITYFVYWYCSKFMKGRRSRRISRISFAVIIFMPILQVGHPTIIMPAWYAIYVEPNTSPLIILFFWMVPTVIIELGFYLYSTKGKII